MSLSENTNGFTMPVQPMGGYYGGSSGGFGGWGDGSFWIIILFLFMMSGWNNGFGGGFGGNGAIPYMMNNTTNTDVQRGFDQNAVMTGINGINNAVTTGFGNVQTALCSGFAGVNAGVSNGFAQAEIANNARQIADMQQAFASQTAITSGLTGLQSQLAQCCCDNRAATNDLKYTVATEACADRSAISDALRDVIASNTANTQAILDKMCQQELDALKTQNANLQTQLNMANLAASQNAQTAQITAGQRSLANEVEQYIAPNPKPAYIVQSPYCCNQNAYGCGCGA